jgi:hypothetical protein
MTTKVEWQDIAPGSSVGEFAAKNNLDIEALGQFSNGLLCRRSRPEEMPKPAKKLAQGVFRSRKSHARVYISLPGAEGS